MFKSIITVIKRNKNVIKYGVITNTAIGIFLRGIGDVIQQNIEIKNDEKKKEKSAIKKAKQEFDWTRTSKIKAA